MEINDGVHSIFAAAAGQYPLIFGMDGGAFSLDIEQQADKSLPFLGVFFTGRFSQSAYGEPTPNYEIYVFYAVDFADEPKECSSELITAKQLLREFIRNLSPYLTGRPTALSHWHGHAVSAVYCEISLSPPTDCEGQPQIITPSDILLRDLSVTENGEYVAEEGTAWRRAVVEVDSGEQDLNLFTRTHSLRGAIFTSAIQDIRGWQVRGRAGTVVRLIWGWDGNVLFKSDVPNFPIATTYWEQVVTLSEGDYLFSCEYRGNVVGLRLIVVVPWDTAKESITIADLAPSTNDEWTHAEVRFTATAEMAGKVRFRIMQSRYSRTPMWLARPLLTRVETGITDYVPAASDIAEGFYENAPFYEEEDEEEEEE